MLTRRLDLRLEQVSRPDGNRLLAAEDQAAKLGVGGDRRPSVKTLQVVLELLRHGRVALSADDVVDRLRSDHLPDGGNQGRVAELEADGADPLGRPGEAAGSGVCPGPAVDGLEGGRG